MAFTTMAKFGLYALALSAFWGFWAGMNYAVSFVLIQLLHFTVATKQPAMTARHGGQAQDGTGDAAWPNSSEGDPPGALAGGGGAGQRAGGVPGRAGLALLIAQATGSPAISVHQAEHVFESLHLLGPSLFFAAFTGCCCSPRASSRAGPRTGLCSTAWTRPCYNPRITRVLGRARGRTLGRFAGEPLGVLRPTFPGLHAGPGAAFAGFWLGWTCATSRCPPASWAPPVRRWGWQALYLPPSGGPASLPCWARSMYRELLPGLQPGTARRRT